MKAYKGFKKDLTCRGFQFVEGKEYKEDNIKIGERGFHACEDPLDILFYYDITESVFHEVEILGDVQKRENEDTKICTNHIKIGAKIELKNIIKASIDFVFSKVKSVAGDSATNASSGDYATNASSGYYAKNASSGDYAKNASSGNSAKNASSGHSATNASSGDCATNASSGHSATNASSGDYATNASSGDYATQIMEGKYSVSVDAGKNGKAKGKKGCWICLTEWAYSETEKESVPICCKAVKIDGKKIKEDVFYTLKDKKFVEVV